MSTLNPIAVLGQMRDLARQDFGHANVVIRKAVDVLEMLTNYEGSAHGNSERLIVMGALSEVLRARKLFPGNNLNILALCEEHGELVKACMDEKADAIYKEGIQTIAMVIRVLTEGDVSTNQFRASKGLPPIVAQKGRVYGPIKTVTFDDQEDAERKVSELLSLTNARDIRINMEDNELHDTEPHWTVSWIECEQK